MSVFTAEELAYLQQRPGLGRLGTIAADGTPHIVPVGWSYNPAFDSIDIGGRSPAEFAASQKFRHVRRFHRAGFVVDDVLPPFQPRCVTVRGRAEAVDEIRSDGTRVALIRLFPDAVASWGVPEAAEPGVPGSVPSGGLL